VTANVVWYAVKRCAQQAGIANLAPHDLRRTCARLCHDCSGDSNRFVFSLGTPPFRQRSDTSGANRNCGTRLMIASKSQLQATPPKMPRPAHFAREIGDSVLYHSLFESASPQWVLSALFGPIGGHPREAVGLVNTCRLERSRVAADACACCRADSGGDLS
jgi:hypothetical protein